MICWPVLAASDPASDRGPRQGALRRQGFPAGLPRRASPPRGGVLRLLSSTPQPVACRPLCARGDDPREADSSVDVLPCALVGVSLPAACTVAPV
jgi:hypothetical protein